jgi:hypothetical protein
MLEQLAFALVAVALAAPFLVPVLLSQLGQSSQDTAAVAQDERPIRLVGRKIATVGAVLIAASAFVQIADAQQSWRPLPNDPEQFRVIEECLECPAEGLSTDLTVNNGLRAFRNEKRRPRR